MIDADNVSRSFLLMLFAIQPLVALTTRSLLRSIFGELRKRGFNTRYMLVVGTGPLAQRFADLVESRPSLGIHVIGHVSLPAEPQDVVTRPRLGSLAVMQGILHSQVVDEVALCLPPTALFHLEPLSRLASEEGKTVRSTLGPLEPMSNAVQEEMDGFLIRSLVRDDQRALGLVIKRLVDIVGASVAFNSGESTYARDRGGHSHSGWTANPVPAASDRAPRPEFTIYKFRTMVPDAETRLDDVAHLNIRVGHAFKAAADPRATKFGSFLRRTSLDELPQLWNVLKGEMSLVGPRPPCLTRWITTILGTDGG